MTTFPPSEYDLRAAEAEAQMTDDERFTLLVSLIGAVPAIGIPRDQRIPEDVTNMSAGYTPGIARLGVPALQSSDASMGVTNPGYRPDDAGATAFPASIAIGASFNPQLARDGGAAIGREARSRGFNIQLAGGINLHRDARGGRNFEYYSEDPLMSGVFGAAAVNGIQGEGVISTLKHYTLNCNEINRHWLDAVISPAAHRESDLLAFQIAIELAQPGSIMSGYNKINGEYASGSHHLLSDVLKGAWGYRGYVMSDWGAVAQWDYAISGLDQESGIQLDVQAWGDEMFTHRLREAYAEGKLSSEHLSDMVRRILRSLYAVGADQWGPAPEVDMARHNEIALEGARQGIVLLQNDGVLPLATDEPLKVAVIGGYAQLGVPTGTGSGAVTPVGGLAASVNIGGARGLMGNARNLNLLPSSPLKELRKLMPDARIEYDGSYTVAESVLLAQRSDVVIVFGIRVEGEGFDLPDLSLPWGQDAVIDAVATANPNTVVVLETGNPVSMPWRDKVRAIVQAWYPGQAGGQAIAEVLTGAVNPSGRLPITFPASLDDTPRPVLPGIETGWGTPTTIEYTEGAEIGYRWYAQTGRRPMFDFGHGLSYTAFDYSDLTVMGGATVTATFTVTNTGEVAGADVPQLYLTDAAGEKRMRLLGFERVTLEPGESREVTVIADPRLLARFDGPSGLGQWRVDGGIYHVVLGRSAGDPVLTADAELAERVFGA
ncbi:MAG TPA: beta-glucosidase [Arachnia sp.]|nr:beta-glucosidase [Arachnia sp.]HMT86960.1 beta-glucosidase [Arachnia sp.]